jgi:predicted dehydrogenase
MKVGVIGAGAWGKNLVRTYNSLGRLGAIAEANPIAGYELQTEYPEVKVYTSYHELLDSDISAVSIATPAENHFEVAKAALLAGKDVSVEKPLVLSSAEGQELVDIAEGTGRILMVGHLLLYQPAIQFIRKAIVDGLIGKVYSFHQERMNLGRARSVENVLWSFGVHDVAALLFLAGTGPYEVTANGQCALQPNIEDDFYIHMNFRGGMQAHLHCSWLWPELRRRLTVVGSEGMLVFDEPAKSVTLYKKRIGSDLKNIDEGSEVVFSSSDEPLKLELQHFIECCENRQRPLSDGASGVEVLKVLERANRSLVNA